MSLFMALSGAVQALALARHKLDGLQVAFLRNITVAALLLPFACMVPWSHSTVFYLATLGAALLAAVGDSLVLSGAAHYGAGVVTRIMPAAPLVGFLVWFALHPAQQLAMFAHSPAVTGGVVVTLVGCVVALMFMRRNAINHSAFYFLLPAIVCYGVNDTLSKTAQTHAPFGAGQLAYIFLVCLSAGAFTGVALMAKNRLPKTKVALKKLMPVVGLLIVFYLLAVTGRTLSMLFVPNPGYVSIIGNATPVLVFAWHKLRGVRDDASPLAGFAFVAFIILLIFMVTHLRPA